MFMCYTYNMINTVLKKLYLSWIPLAAAAIILLAGGAFLTVNMALSLSVKAQPPAEWVVMTPTSNKYHRHGCTALKKTKMMNVLYRVDAIERGYSPCKICRPDGDEAGNSEKSDNNGSGGQE